MPSAGERRSDGVTVSRSVKVGVVELMTLLPCTLLNELRDQVQALSGSYQRKITVPSSLQEFPDETTLARS